MLQRLKGEMGMKEYLENKITVNRSGTGGITYRISVPTAWADKMGISEEERDLILTFDGEEIIVKKNKEAIKVENEMLIIKNNSSAIYDGVDFELENGILLFTNDWNGEIYGTGFNPRTKENDGNHYKPVYKEISEDEFEIIGFEEN